MDTTTHPLIHELIRLNDEQSRLFAATQLSRQQYRAIHPTEVAAFKCMDGRVHLPAMTRTPLGIIQPWRNLGGKFDLGWPHFGDDVEDWVDYAVGRGRDCIIFVTYHFSAGNPHRGCKGFNYDVAAARAFTKRLRDQVVEVFQDTQVVYPIQVGIETDEDALILHGEHGETLDLGKVEDVSPEGLMREIQRLYNMKPRMVADLLPMLLGNIAHIQEVRSSHRPVQEVEHRERVLAVGRGFDWLHKPNFALIVGPFSPNLPEPITIAGRLIKSNMDEGRIPADGVVLLASAAYRKEDSNRHINRMRQKAMTLREIALAAIREDVPDLLPYIHPLTVVVNLDTRKMEILNA